jgi:serine/threonine-protein kinase
VAKHPDPDQQASIQAQMARILASSRFRESARMSGFLTFVVERTLAGAEDEVKETSIGIEVYGRGTNFDPQTDSIVRVEASRLRSKLRDYYLEDGKGDPWKIELPKGTYVPVFSKTATPTNVESRDAAKDQPPGQPAAKHESWWGGIWILAAGVVLLGVAAWLGWQAWQSGTPAQQHRVAVLPFEDLSETRDLEYFCEGLAEEVIDSLSHMEGVSVLARGSSFRFRGPEVDARKVGQQLQVDRLLTGSVRRAGKTFRVNAQLVDTRTGVAIWTNRFDRESGNELRVQEDISREVSKALEITMVPRMVGAGAPVSAEAHNLYLKGRYYYWKSTAEDEARARQFFEQAIELSPQFAAAHAGLADTLASLPLRGVKAGEAEIARARTAADRALALDPKLLDSLLAKAHIARNLDYDWGEAERLYRKAVSLHPGVARSHNSFGVLLSLMGRFDEADRELRDALRLDPLSMQVQTNLALNLYRQGRYAEAVAQSEKASAIDPNFRNAYSPKAAALAEMGRFSEAFAALNTLRERSGGELSDNHLALEGHIHAKKGDRAKALAALKELERRAAGRYVPRAAMADVLLGLGENRRALDLMEEALKQREVLLAGLLLSPHSKGVAGEPRFKEIQKQIAKR